MWVFGTFVFVTGSLLNFASYPFAPQSMLASLESVQFVSNLLFGKVMHGATITYSMWFGTFITLTGTLLAGRKLCRKEASSEGGGVQWREKRAANREVAVTNKNISVTSLDVASLLPNSLGPPWRRRLTPPLLPPSSLLSLILVSFSSKVALQLTMDDLMALWYEPAWVAYLIMMGGALVGFGALYKLYEVKKNAMR